MNNRQTHVQFARYVIVGLASNVLLFLCYLGLTALGVGHKTAMSALYLVGVMQTFVANKRWSFRYAGSRSGSLARYFAAYGIGYVANFLVLVLLVDRLGFPHRIVQGAMIAVLGVSLFLMQKYWVFRQPGPAPKGAPTTGGVS